VVALVLTFLVTMAEEFTTFYPETLPGASNPGVRDETNRLQDS
jgi:hypothetical protein